MESSTTPAPATKRRRWVVIAWAILAVLALAIAVLAIAGGGGAESGGDASIQTYEVPDDAMAPTYAEGAKVEVDQGAYASAKPAVGDVVVFHPPAGAEDGGGCGVHPRAGEPCPRPKGAEAPRIFLQRVVAVPGDTLSIEHGHPVLNGTPQTEEPFARPCGNASLCELPRTIKIGPGEYFVLGDNRGASIDSRSWGPVPESWIVGRVE